MKDNTKAEKSKFMLVGTRAPRKVNISMISRVSEGQHTTWRSVP